MAKSDVKEFLSKHGLQLTVQILGIFVLGLNTFLAVKLVPITERIIVLERSVIAVEKQHDQVYSNVATKSEIEVIRRDIQYVSERLDGLISLIVKK